MTSSFFSIFNKSFIENPFLVISTLIFLVTISIIDFKTLKIPNKIVLPYFLLRFILIPLAPIKSDLIWLLFTGLVVIIPALIHNRPMGGDVKALISLSVYLGENIIPFLALFYMVGLVIGLIACGITKDSKKKMPLAPFMLIAYFIFLAIQMQAI